MGLADYSYRLKAQGGDSTPHDEKGVSGNLSGGTITLVDLGGGDYAWQFAGRATVAVPNRTTAPSSSGGGMTLAVRLAISTSEVSYSRLVGWVTDGASDSFFGPFVGFNNSTNNVRCNFADDTGNFSAFSQNISTATRTFVLKARTASGSSTDYFDAWIDTVSRGSTNPSGTSSASSYTAHDMDSVFAGSLSTGVIRVSDIVIWPEELTNQQCTDLADNGIRATLDTGGGTIDLAGAATAGATASATLIAQRNLASAAVAGALATGALSVNKALTGAAIGAALGSATLTAFSNVWRIPTSMANGTAVHVMVLNGASPSYGILAQGVAVVAGGFIDLPGSGVIGAKAFALIHNYSDNTATTSIRGGPAIATLTSL